MSSQSRGRGDPSKTAGSHVEAGGSPSRRIFVGKHEHEIRREGVQ